MVIVVSFHAIQWQSHRVVNPPWSNSSLLFTTFSSLRHKCVRRCGLSLLLLVQSSRSLLRSEGEENAKLWKEADYSEVHISTK